MAEKLYKILREKQLPEFVGLRRTTINELVQSGEFPQPIPLNDSGRAKGWLEAEVAAWQAARIAKRKSR
jgi:prophage regulatory protein